MAGTEGNLGPAGPTIGKATHGFKDEQNKNSKRLAESMTENELQQKRRRTKSGKKKDTDGAEEEDKVGAPKLSYFEEQKETDLLMRGLIERRRQNKHGEYQTASLQLLSEWRMAHEILRQMKESRRSTGLASLRGAEKNHFSLNTVFDPKFLEILQLGCATHLKNILTKAANVSKQRSFGSNKPTNFVVIDDLRRGVGDIRRREERIAKQKEEEERQLLLRAAGHRRADEETRERAQKAREELVGKQQAVAANKALAATLGGGEAKWAKWGSKTSSSTEKLQKDQKPRATEANTISSQPQLVQPDKEPSNRKPELKPFVESSQPSTCIIAPQDVISVLDALPEYSNSGLLYKMMNQSTTTQNT